MPDEESTQIIGKDVLDVIASQSRGQKRKACLIIIAGNNVGMIYSLDQNELIIGRGEETEIRVLHEAVSRKHARVFRQSNQNQTFWIQDLGSTNGTFCNGERVTEKILNDGDKIMIGTTTILKFSFQDSLEKKFQEHIFESAVRDGLTKCFNKKYFEEHLDTEFRFAARHGYQLSLLMFDIDHFKKINDTHGHPAGDYMLKTMSRLIAEMIRNEDIFARYGGEEFVVIIRETDKQAAFLMAEHLRVAVENYRFEFGGVVIPLTISLGIATYKDGEPSSTQALLEKADFYLYRAKQSGRNRVEKEHE